MRVLSLLLLFACGPKAGAPVVAAKATPTTVVGVLGTDAAVAVSALPEPVQTRLTALLVERNLTPVVVPEDEWSTAFASRRNTPQRLGWLDDRAEDTELLLLVESEVSFYSQLSGRYRWTVEVTATLAPAADPAQGVTEVYQVPVFLQFHHQREAEALEEAAPVIARKVALLVDGYLGGLP